ncbi:pyridoxal phosphate-dependent transferase [Cryomyces antarcticus]
MEHTLNGDEEVSMITEALSYVLKSSEPAKVLPEERSLEHARNSLLAGLPDEGLGFQATIEHLSSDVAPALNRSSLSPNYYGFVTGGATPAAAVADHLVVHYDQNVQVHLPHETIATEVENRALELLCNLLYLDPAIWSHRTFTTGATASNILGLACARERVVARAAARKDYDSASFFEEVGNVRASIAEVGILSAMRDAGLEGVCILTTVPHSSLRKAASLIGLGRASVKDVGRKDAPHRFDLELLGEELKNPGIANIVVISCGEVNTGLFATNGMEEMAQIRTMCDICNAWIHVDGAFGLLGRLLNSSDYDSIRRGCEGIELADSITGDCHKLLNTPYDCGFFLSCHRSTASQVFQNPNAAYLNAVSAIGIASPLHVGIENSRRFRALPVYATLSAYGRSGYRDMLERQVRFARAVAKFVLGHGAYELLPERVPHTSERDALADIYIIVLFRARDETLNKDLVKHINASRTIYVSGTSWKGFPACRFAVSNWRVDSARDLPIVTRILDEVSSVNVRKTENIKL